MNAGEVKGLAERLLKLERIITICEKPGGPVTVSYDGWDGEEWLEDCMENAVKVEIKRICEHEAEIVRKQIKGKVLNEALSETEKNLIVRGLLNDTNVKKRC